MVVTADIPSALSTPRGGNRPSAEENTRMSFSNSWPDPKMFEDAGKPPKKKLDPISGRFELTKPRTNKPPCAV